MKPLMEVTLRNPYLIYPEVEGSFEVTSIDSNGGRHLQSVDAEIADWLYSVSRGETLTREVAGSRLFSAPARLQIPYRDGPRRSYKLDYFAQTVLLVLVATGRASYAKEGRAFYYEVADGGAGRSVEA